MAWAGICTTKRTYNLIMYSKVHTNSLDLSTDFQYQSAKLDEIVVM